MNEFVYIQKSLERKAKKNLKWQILIAVILIKIDIYLFMDNLSLMHAVKNITIPSIIVVIFQYLIIIITCMMLISWIKIIYYIRQAIKYSFSKPNDFINLKTVSNNNVWLKKYMDHVTSKKMGFFNIFSKKYKFYLLWGVIETEEYYRLAMLNTSESDQLVILNINKQEFKQYYHQSTITKWIRRMQKRYKKFNKPLLRYLYSSFVFYVKD